jgi:hypothetical protein
MRPFALALTALGLLVHVSIADAQRSASPMETPSAPSLPSLPVAVRSGAITAPDSVASGWTRVHVVKEKRRHVVVLYRLRDGSNPAAFLAALDSARMTPGTGRAVGGTEVVVDGEVVMDLAPGRYVLACMVRDTIDAKRHLAMGEAKSFVVTPKVNHATAKAPRADTEVRMLDFAYRAPERWRRGAQWVRVSNEGKEDHLLLIARLRDGATLREWTTAKITDTVVAKPVTGVARTSPGGVVYLPLALSPGRYVLYCRIQHAASGVLHEKLGMFKQIDVE